MDDTEYRVSPAPGWGQTRLTGPRSAPVTVVCSRQADADEVARRAVDYPRLAAENARLRAEVDRLSEGQIDAALADIRGAGRAGG